MTDQDTMTNVRGGAAVGAATGGILGALVSFIMSTTPQAIPVIGPTVGQGVIAAVVVGLLAGVGLGALAGALFGAFSPTQPRPKAGERARLNEAESVVLPGDTESEPEFAPIESDDSIGLDDLRETSEPEVLETTDQDMAAPVRELEGPLEIEAEIEAAEAAPAEADASDVVVPISNAAQPVHTSRTRRARRVAPRYELPETKKRVAR